MQWRVRNQVGKVKSSALEYILYFEDRDTGVRLCEDKQGKQTRWVLVIEGDDNLDEMKRFGERAWVERERPASSTATFISDSL